MNRIRGLLFDKDGTLVDAFAGWIALNQRLFADLKARYPHRATVDDLNRLLGIEGDQVVPGGVITSGTEVEIYQAHHQLLGPGARPWPEMAEEIAGVAHELFQAEPPRVRPLGAVGPALRSLQARYRLGIATSDSYHNATRDLGPHGGDCIEYWATADRLVHPKPHPESVFAFAAAVGLVPGEIGFVGDSAVDLACARAAGVGLFVAVASATCPAEVRAGADQVVHSVDELPALLSSFL